MQYEDPLLKVGSPIDTLTHALLQIGSLTLRKLRDLEKESGMTGGAKDGAKKKAPAEEVRSLTPDACMRARLPNC